MTRSKTKVGWRVFHAAVADPELVCGNGNHTRIKDGPWNCQWACVCVYIYIYIYMCVCVCVCVCVCFRVILCGNQLGPVEMRSKVMTSYKEELSVLLKLGRIRKWINPVHSRAQGSTCARTHTHAHTHTRTHIMTFCPLETKGPPLRPVLCPSP